MKCSICPRKCGADREKGEGYCGAPADFRIARAALHFWEEPPISGDKGSGAVFFSGCNLGCVFCQNYSLSHECYGESITGQRLRGIFSELVSQGAHNINLVNPTHYAKAIADNLNEAKPSVPVVYNTSGYDSVPTLRSLEGLIDIYLPDFKYASGEKALRYSAAENYPQIALEALKEMHRQCPENIYDDKGIMKKGMIIRHLILPKNTNESIRVLELIRENLGCEVTISLMSQYTPCGEANKYPELNRKITRREYEKVLSAAYAMGFERVFTQEFTSADEAFIPQFDLTGV